MRRHTFVYLHVSLVADRMGMSKGAGGAKRGFDGSMTCVQGDDSKKRKTNEEQLDVILLEFHDAST